MSNLGYIVGMILLLLVGIWLALSAIHILLTVLGWIFIIGAAVVLIKVLMGRSRGRSTV